ncbi:MAG: hypothetical protein OER95_05810 [Acidimicrobiia bacterium]|nr:hypothetical protein [Acidimicrobiia bacterium]
MITDNEDEENYGRVVWEFPANHGNGAANERSKPTGTPPPNNGVSVSG